MNRFSKCLKKGLSLVLTLGMAISAFTFNANAAWIDDAIPTTDNYEYIANETFENYDNTDAVKADGRWVSKNKSNTATYMTDFTLETEGEEESANKFLRYTRKNNLTDYYGQPLHDLAFSPTTQASLFGGKNVVLEFKLRSTVTTPGDLFSIRINNADRGQADYPQNTKGKYALMNFGAANTNATDDNRWGYGVENYTSSGLSATNMITTNGDKWVPFKIVIDVDGKTVKYYVDDELKDTMDYQYSFWKMSALETLNFCMLSGGTVDDRFDIDDVKIYYSNPAPALPELMINSDEIILQFDREIDASTLNDSTLQVHSSSTGAYMGNNGTYYDAKARQYHLKLTPYITTGNWHISLGGENGYEYGNVKNNTAEHAVYSKNLADKKTGNMYNGHVWWNQSINREATVSHDASLKDLTFNGYSVSNFAPDTYEYEVEIPTGTALSSELFNATPAADDATVAFDGGTWKGERVKITVTAPDGVTKKTYYVIVNTIGRNGDTVLNNATVALTNATVEIPAVSTTTTASVVSISTAAVVYDTTTDKRWENTVAASVDASAASEISYNILGNPEGINVNPEGQVTVTEDAMPGTYTIEAIVKPSAAYPYQTRVGGRTTITVTGTPKSKIYFVNQASGNETTELVTGENGYVYGAARVYNAHDVKTNYTIVLAMYQGKQLRAVRTGAFDVESKQAKVVKSTDIDDRNWLGLTVGQENQGFSIKCFVFETGKLSAIAANAEITQ